MKIKISLKLLLALSISGLTGISQAHAQSNWGTQVEETSEGTWQTLSNGQNRNTHNNHSRVEVLTKRLVQDPHNESLQAEYSELFPIIDDMIVIEGDIRLKRSKLGNHFERIKEMQLRAMNESKSGYAIAGKITKFVAADPFLVINLDQYGNPDYYKTLEERKLTYSIDYSSFPQSRNGQRPRYEIINNYMKSAGAAWSNACVNCGIEFIHRSELDRANVRPTENQADFIVAYIKNAPFIASAFFPSDDYQNKILYVTDSLFSGRIGADALGVMRHELGHVLGMRHEHIRNIPGCSNEGNMWRALTQYDSDSVMHYLCGGAGTYKMNLSQKDIAGLNIIYGRPPEIENPNCRC